MLGCCYDCIYASQLARKPFLHCWPVYNICHTYIASKSCDIWAPTSLCLFCILRDDFDCQPAKACMLSWWRILYIVPQKESCTAWLYVVQCG